MLQNGDTALHLASKNGHIETVQLLLANGIDVHWKNEVNRNVHIPRLLPVRCRNLLDVSATEVALLCMTGPKLLSHSEVS